MARSGRAGLVRMGLGLLLALAVPAGVAAQAGAGSDPRVEELLARMTVEEKVGEMTQLTLSAVSKTRGTASVPHELDLEKLEDALVRHHVGSLLNVWDIAFTGEQWQALIRTVQETARRKRLPIPVLYGVDAVHGHNYLAGGTLFPQNLALAATWNPGVVRDASHVTALETRATGVPWNFAPVLDLGRQPLWSRFFETFGEDVHLASVMGVAAVEGLQGRSLAAPDRVAATGKHFLGYGMPRTGKDRTPAWIPERQLREYFVPPFQAAVDAGLATMMINSGDVNGVPVHASREILTGLLREEMGFRGVVVTDWEDVIKLHTVHRVAPTPKEAVRMAVVAGIDMSMVPYDLSFHTHLVELVREGAVPEARIDESVRRILKLKLDLGLFDEPLPDPARLGRIGLAQSRRVSRAAAEEAITLLENDGILPLAGRGRVLVTGPGATSLPALHGSWSYTWQGTDAAAYPAGVPTVLDALRAELGGGRVVHVPGTGFTEEIDVAVAAAAARRVDVALVVLAEEPSTEKPGDIEDLTLPEAQRRLVRSLAATGTPVVLVLLQNRPRIVSDVVGSARAVLLAYQPGPYGGEAIAGVLSGRLNPSGRLPFTYPRHTGSLAHYDHPQSEELGLWEPEGGFRPQWELGHGLSYTSFAYGDLVVDAAEVGPSDTLSVSVTVENTGRRAGKEVVQLYVRDLYASVTPPVKRLRAFEKVSLRPGERRTVRFRVPVRDLAFIGLENRPVVEPGEFRVLVGGLEREFVVR